MISEFDTGHREIRIENRSPSIFEKEKEQKEGLKKAATLKNF